MAEARATSTVSMVAKANTDNWPTKTGQASGAMRRALPARVLVGGGSADGQHRPALSPAQKRNVWRRITLEGTAWRFNRYAERAQRATGIDHPNAEALDSHGARGPAPR